MQDIIYKIVNMKRIRNKGIFGNILYTVEILLYFQYYLACVACWNFSGKKRNFLKKRSSSNQVPEFQSLNLVG